MRRAPAAGLVLLALLGGCEHAQPFGGASAEPNVPLSTSFPRRLTFGGGADVEPVWLPDGSGFIYSFPTGQPDNDRCLGVLPAEGGHRVATVCHRPVDDADSTNALWDPAAGPGGRLAYVRETSVPLSLAPQSRELVVASLSAPDPGTAIRRFPYTGADGKLRSSASHLRWADSTTLYFIADSVVYFTIGTFADTITTPIEIMRVSLAAGTPDPVPVPGTSHATSLTADSTGAIFYTLPGDGRVWRLPNGQDTASVFYDFGARGVPSDVWVRGDRLVAVVGGTLVRARTGDTTVVPIPLPAGLAPRHPALSPSATRVVVEGHGATVATNLWLLQAP